MSNLISIVLPVHNELLNLRFLIESWNSELKKISSIKYEFVIVEDGSTDGTKELIEAEVRRFVQDGYDLALKTITKNKKRFENLAQGLLEYETLTGAEIKKVMEGQTLNRDEDEDDSEGAGGAPSVTAIPKTKTKPKTSDGGMEPEPAG